MSDKKVVVRYQNVISVVTESLGWTQQWGQVPYGDGVVTQLIGYIGGEGAQPTENIGNYVGVNGFVENIEEAVISGLQGDEGLSAYHVAVKNGFEGTEAEWEDSLKGKDGVSPVIASLAPTDPAPTLDGVYKPTITQNEAGTPIIYTNAGNLSVNTAVGGADYGKSVEFIKNESVWVKIGVEMPKADNKIEPWVPNVYLAGRQVLHDGQVWTADAISTTKEPSLSNQDWIPEIDKVSNEELQEASSNLFEIKTSRPLERISPFFRYTGGIKTEFTNNEYQTKVGKNLIINVPQSGTIGRAFRFPSSIDAQNEKYTDNGLWVDFKINRLQEGAGGGIGFDGVGVFRAATGGVRALTVRPDGSYSTVILLPQANSTPLVIGDTVTYRYFEDAIEIYKNGVREFKYILPSPPVSYLVDILFTGHPFTEISTYSVNDVFKTKLLEFIESNAPDGGYSNFFEKIGSTFYFYAHLKDRKFIRWEVSRMLDMSPLVYVDYWRLFGALLYELDQDGVFQYTGISVITGGENEAVYRKSGGVDDATGGYHGDETATRVNFYSDKGLISIEENIPLTPCKEFFYIIESEMHATATGGVPVEGHPVEAIHLKRTSFTSEGYRTFNRVIWQLPITVSHWNIGISCISKGVSRFATTEEHFNYEAMTGSEENKMLTTDPRFKEYYGYNAETGLSVFAYSDLLHGAFTPAPNNPFELFIWDRSGDSKYYRRTPRKTVEIGEVWETVFRATFK